MAIFLAVVAVLVSLYTQVLSQTTSCSHGKVYQECGSSCPLTCDNYTDPPGCIAVCVSGCFCPEGQVELNDACVETSRCPPTTPYVNCGSDAFIACDSEFLYCIQHNKTRRAYCVPSCVSRNGGCKEKEVCTTVLLEDGDTTLRCQALNDLSSECPAGLQIDSCGDLCQNTCEDYLAGGRACIEICAPPACVCPAGLVLFRDRCVDPRLCYVLLKYQPPINPLPLVSENQYLYSLAASGVSATDFQQDSFLRAVRQLLADQGFSDVEVGLHGIYQDQNLQIVIQLSGDGVNERTSSQFTVILGDNSNVLPHQIQDVTMVDVDRVGERKCFWRKHMIEIIAAGGTLVLLTILATALTVVTCCLYKKKKVTPHRKLKMELSDILSDGDNPAEKKKLEFQVMT